MLDLSFYSSPAFPFYGRYYAPPVLPAVICIGGAYLQRSGTLASGDRGDDHCMCRGICPPSHELEYSRGSGAGVASLMISASCLISLSCIIVSCRSSMSDSAWDLTPSATYSNSMRNSPSAILLHRPSSGLHLHMPAHLCHIYALAALRTVHRVCRDRVWHGTLFQPHTLL